MDIHLAIEIIWVIIFAFYTFTILLITKKIYDYFVDKKHIKKSIVIYYNRKFIHIFAGGFVVLTVPFVFSEPYFPLIASILITIIMLIYHKSGNLMYWFQTKDNISDVSFCLMWGIAIFILWIVFNNPWIAVMPPAFIAFGDGITGIVRNFGFKERNKHPVGNLYMAGVCIPIGYYLGSLSNIPNMTLWGIAAAIIATLFERYEIGSIDDNILITISSTIILFIGAMIATA